MADLKWRDYDPHTMDYIENWLDASAVRLTGLDEGFRHFYEYWAEEAGFLVGENYWCKVVFAAGVAVAVIAFCYYEEKILIMEVLVAPWERGRGLGTKLLKELLKTEELMGLSLQRLEAVIFPDNTASQRAFEKAGFHYHHTHEDGASALFTYEMA